MKKSILGIFLSILLLITSSFVIGCSGKTFTVRFEGGEGSVLVSGKEVQVVSDVKELEVPVYEKEGYNFLGWDIDLSTIRSNTTVRAQWRSKEDSIEYRVRFAKECVIKVKENGELVEKTAQVSINVPTLMSVGVNQTLGTQVPTAENILVEEKYRNDYIFYYWYILDANNKKIPVDGDLVFDIATFGNESREITILLLIGPKWSERR